MAYQLIPGDKARRAIDPATGAIISRRQYDKLYKTFGLSYEEKAKSSRSKKLAQSLARPARGRKSLQKLTEQEREFIVNARIEEHQQKKERKELARAIAKQERKVVRRTKITKNLLKPGSKGARGKFNTYAEYLISLKEAQDTGVISDYALGMVGFDEHTAEDRGITVFGLRVISNKPYTEEVFETRMMEERMERQYFVFQYYFIHLAYKSEFYTKRKADAEKRKSRSNSKKRKSEFLR